ncbi:MAG: hypothetical protein JWM71_2267, partial [Solirubrobacteraceae bacterium]|nr:hypothetical protein [Solirubrobacteraceae bacterium]
MSGVNGVGSNVGLDGAWSAPEGTSDELSSGGSGGTPEKGATAPGTSA